MSIIEEKQIGKKAEGNADRRTKNQCWVKTLWNQKY